MVVEKAPKDAPVVGILWSSHFQDACAACGMETALVKMLAEPDMYKAVDDKILAFYLNANEIFYEAIIKGARKSPLQGLLIKFIP